MISWSRARRVATFFVAAFTLYLGAARTRAATAVDEQAVLDTVQRFFDAMADRDVDGTREVVIPEGRFFSVRSEDGVKAIRSFTNQEYMQGLADREPNVVERMWDPEVRIHGGIATVWTPYDFYLEGEFHHCGIDAFDLVNDGAGWKITGGVYTVEESGCPESPLGAP